MAQRLIFMLPLILLLCTCNKVLANPESQNDAESLRVFSNGARRNLMQNIVTGLSKYLHKGHTFTLTTAPVPAPAQKTNPAPAPALPPKNQVPSPLLPPKNQVPAPVLPPKNQVPAPVLPPKNQVPAPVLPPKKQVPAPVLPPKNQVPAPVPAPIDHLDCGALCKRRCSLHSRQNVCWRACGTCCLRCKCVPPGTFGNREVCGTCYTNMTTHGSRPKCP